MMNSGVRIRSLRVVRGRTRAVDDVDLDIPAGQVTGLLGPSGSGKTSLLRAIVGVQIVDSGEVEVLGRPAGSPELRRRVGYVTQSPSVYEDLTVAENLRYFARLLRSRGDTSGAGVERVLATVGLTEAGSQLARTLSGGQLSRVSLATALLGSPELLVLDEPTVGLDPVLRASLWQTFRGIAEQGTTVIVSSHVMDEASRCDLLVLLRQGRVLARATPDELLERTATEDAESAFLSLIGDRA
ncbi:ABC transporter ATP-binding protein [Georgenia deserti]|uniref:ABC transporter ATP-binding protein n=1 Tax=Georgenia deserti TaxID=2093781 RepID=A0ABW4L560_9MICO